MDYPRHDATINVPSATASAGVQPPVAMPPLTSGNAVLFDPENPTDADELLKQYRGKMTDPRACNHNCPFCRQTMRWELFEAHIRPCIDRWQSLYRTAYALGGIEEDAQCQ